MSVYLQTGYEWQFFFLQQVIILNTNKIQAKICAEILYMRDYQLDFF